VFPVFARTLAAQPSDAGISTDTSLLKWSHNDRRFEQESFRHAETFMGCTVLTGSTNEHHAKRPVSIAGTIMSRP
jgi:hypothetical protein